MAWTGRLLAESTGYSASRVVTLTYADPADQYSDLNYKHIQDFLKIHRQETNEHTRYFVCGEFGSESGHAHWHMVLFGEQSWQPEFRKKAVFCDLRGWTDVHGFASCMRLVPETAAYTCGYTLKKGKNLTPFLRCSLKPSISFTQIDCYSEQVFRRYGQKPIPVPSWWVFNGKKYPLNDGAARRFKQSYLKLGGRLEHKPKWLIKLETDAYHRSEEYFSEETNVMLKRDAERTLNGTTIKEKTAQQAAGSWRI
jgi:hypothetical protein